ncbi:hypothetical protein D3C78_1470260 [compost metagenome]
MNGCQFVASDATQADFFGTGSGIECPTAGNVLDGNRKHPGFFADHQMRTIRAVKLNQMPFPIERKKGVDIIAVDVLGWDVTLPVAAE